MNDEVEEFRNVLDYLENIETKEIALKVEVLSSIIERLIDEISKWREVPKVETPAIGKNVEVEFYTDIIVHEPFTLKEIAGHTFSRAVGYSLGYVERWGDGICVIKESLGSTAHRVIPFNIIKTWRYHD